MCQAYLTLCQLCFQKTTEFKCRQRYHCPITQSHTLLYSTRGTPYVDTRHTLRSGPRADRAVRCVVGVLHWPLHCHWCCSSGAHGIDGTPPYCRHCATYLRYFSASSASGHTVPVEPILTVPFTDTVLTTYTARQGTRRWEADR